MDMGQEELGQEEEQEMDVQALEQELLQELDLQDEDEEQEEEQEQEINLQELIAEGFQQFGQALEAFSTGFDRRSSTRPGFGLESDQFKIVFSCVIANGSQNFLTRYNIMTLSNIMACSFSLAAYM